jgi:hypothetical protein
MSSRERRFTDREGNVYVRCEPNKFQQRQLRCVEGARKGQVILDPTCDGPPPDMPAPAPRMDPLIESLYAPPFWEVEALEAWRRGRR